MFILWYFIFIYWDMVLKCGCIKKGLDSLIIIVFWGMVNKRCERLVLCVLIMIEDFCIIFNCLCNV